MRKFQFTLVIVLILCFIIFTVGCSHAPAVVPVSGKVLLHGKPIADCNVMFQPTAKNEIISASGISNAEGFFTLKTIETPRRKGAVVGEYVVLFFWRDPKPPLDDHTIITPPYVIPTKYQQEGIPFIVPVGGQSDIIFDLVP
jgi:hypothetical protein